MKLNLDKILDIIESERIYGDEPETETVEETVFFDVVDSCVANNDDNDKITIAFDNFKTAFERQCFADGFRSAVAIMFDCTGKNTLSKSKGKKGESK